MSMLKTIILSWTLGLLLGLSTVYAVETVDINTATAEQLEEVLDGIGPVKAAAIVEYRKQNGLFKTAQDLMQVNGIGEATFEKNKDRIVVSTPATETAQPAAKDGKTPATDAKPENSKPATEPKKDDKKPTSSTSKKTDSQ